MNSSAQWSALLDEFKEKEAITSDAKLAEALGVTPGYICSVRKGRKQLSLKHAKSVFSSLGRTFDTEVMERLLVPVRVRTYTSKLADVRQYVIQRAAGRCQLCGCAAPFTDKEGRPYLDVYPVLPVRELDTGTPGNLVALCPTCNRKIEVNADGADRRKLQRVVEKYNK